jgi:uncharacterized membrane protein
MGLARRCLCLCRLAAGSVSTNASILRLNFIVTAALAMGVLGEPATPSRIAGLAFALLATWLLAGTTLAGAAAPGERRAQSLAQVVVATLAFGLANFFHTIGLRHGALPETLTVAQAVVFMPLATAIVFVRDCQVSPPRQTFRYSITASIALLDATLLLLKGVAQGEASVVVPIAQMGFIIAALLGIFLLGERLTVRKTLGRAAAMAALAVLAAS